jgi:hypothetical protein
MRKLILTMLGIVAVFAFTLYAVIGETGPIGWINAAQARSDGTYSRSISAFVLMIGLCLVIMGVIYVIEFVQKIRRAIGGPVAPQPVAVAAPIATATATATAVVVVVVAPHKVPMAAPTGWRLGLIVWATFMTLFWACLLGGYGWDWHLRRVDVVSAYAPLQLSRDVEPVRPENGSHLALEGGVPLWDRALSRQSTNPSGSSRTEAIYVPVATADWRQGDPVHFVAQFGEVQQLYDLQRAAGRGRHGRPRADPRRRRGSERGATRLRAAWRAGGRERGHGDGDRLPGGPSDASRTALRLAARQHPGRHRHLPVHGAALGRGPGGEAAGVDEAPARGARGGQHGLRRPVRPGRLARAPGEAAASEMRGPIVSPAEQ